MRGIRIFDNEKNTMYTYFYYENIWYVIVESWYDEFGYSYEICQGLSKEQVKKAIKISDNKEIIFINKTMLAAIHII